MIHPTPRQFIRSLTASTLIAVFAIPQSLIAEASEHLVSPSDLNKAAVDASQKREQNRETLRGFFSSEEAQHALAAAHMNPQQVTGAIAGLSDAELAQLASRATNAQDDFAAGRIGTRSLLLILIGIAALILIIVAVD